MKYYEEEMTDIHPKGCKAMTWEDAEEVEKLNQLNGWGVSASDALRFVADHMDAYLDSEEETKPENIERCVRVMERIEWRLTDANFHSFCKALKEHDYHKAIKMIANGDY